MSLKALKRILLLLGATAFTLVVALVSPANLAITSGLVGPLPPKVDITRPAPYVNCESACLFDNYNSVKLYGKDEHIVRPIASITKLLTALTFLDYKVDWDKEVPMIMSDVENSSRSVLRAGHIYRVRDLIHASLMGSDNRATRALARSTGVSPDSFVIAMNAKARELGFLSMHVEEPTGLSENNVGNAEDVARLLNTAANNETISRILQEKQYTFFSVNKHRQYIFGNTNRLLHGRYEVEGGKTGYIEEAGWCFTARATDRYGHDLTAVVLGAHSNGQRFTQAQKLFDWAFSQLN